MTDYITFLSNENFFGKKKGFWVFTIIRQSKPKRNYLLQARVFVSRVYYTYVRLGVYQRLKRCIERAKPSLIAETTHSTGFIYS